MMIDIDKYPSLALYFYYHYTVERKVSLRPVFKGSAMYFPSRILIKRRRISLLDKIRFYIYDFKLWIRGDIPWNTLSKR